MLFSPRSLKIEIRLLSENKLIQGDAHRCPIRECDFRFALQDLKKTNSRYDQREPLIIPETEPGCGNRFPKKLEEKAANPINSKQQKQSPMFKAIFSMQLI